MSGSQSGTLLHHELSKQIIGAFYEVYNLLVRGLLEGCYQNALYIELCERGLPVEREVPFDVRYKGRVIGEYRVDLLVERKVIVECKTADTLKGYDESQLLHYPRATGTELGMLMYFGSKPLFRRFVHTNGPAAPPEVDEGDTANSGRLTPTPRESAGQTASFRPAFRC
ncbi:GxxExxY protein [Gemmatimonas sp.]|uniref:GxxExxY protein n=1 Tax=Gemmatimonas sp. TaxID=1962908 RepID=UPI003983B4F8